MSLKRYLATSAIVFIAPVIGSCAHNQKGTRIASAQTKAPARDVKVTNGPVVRSVTDTTALITWSTNVSADTLLRYGTSADNFDQIARAPWGGLTHSLLLSNLAPKTTYYFRVGTSLTQNTEPMSATASFTTQTAKRTP
jgi:hypothetical protein